MRSNAYTLVFTMAVTIVLGFFLSLANSALKDRQKLNTQIDMKKNILQSLDFSPSEEKPWTPEIVQAIFDDYISSIVVDKDGIYYSKERRDIPFTGYFTKKKKKGVGKFYNKYRNGKLRILKHYSSLGGNIQTYGEVENNKLNGTWKSYSIRDKLLLSIGNYKNNHLVGMWEHYYPNGRLRFRGKFWKYYCCPIPSDTYLYFSKRYWVNQPNCCLLKSVC